MYPRPNAGYSNYCPRAMASLDTQEGRDQQQEASASQSLDTSVGQELTQEDLERTAREYAQYLVVNCQQEVSQCVELSLLWKL